MNINNANDVSIVIGMENISEVSQLYWKIVTWRPPKLGVFPKVTNSGVIILCILCVIIQ